MAAPTIHATAVMLGPCAVFPQAAGRGVLILGGSGAGKSALALDVLAAGGALAADDRVELLVERGFLIARAPKALQGRIEVRGAGPVPVARTVPGVRLDLAVRCVAAGQVPRLPDPELWRAAPDLPALMLFAFDPRAPQAALRLSALFARDDIARH